MGAESEIEGLPARRHRCSLQASLGESVQARALLEKAERVREKVSDEDRAELDRLTERVRVALTDRSWGDLTAACNELADVLFYLEDV